MIWIIVVAIAVLLASMAEGPTSMAHRTKRLDPGSSDDFGGKLK
jgi:hypothetical protein